jgi:hypothetical protein
MQPCTSICHVQVFSYNQLFSNLIHTTKTRTASRWGRLLITTHLNQSNYLGNQKQGTSNKYDLTLFIRLFKGSESSGSFQGLKSLPVMKPCQTLEEESTQERGRKWRKGQRIKVQVSNQPKRGESHGGKRNH